MSRNKIYSVLRKGSSEMMKSKSLLYLILTFILFNNTIILCWGQEDEYSEQEKESPLHYQAAVRMDFLKNFKGGINQQAGYLGEADILMNFSTGNAGLWEGGLLQIQGMTTHGKKPAADITGDMQAFSNIESDDHTSLYEFWYSQTLFDEKVSIMVGQIDMNAEFSVSENAGSFINSSFGVIPTLSLNNPMSIFPLLSYGAVLRIDYNKNLSLLTSIFNGNPGDFESNPYALNWNYSNENGICNLTELHYNRYKTVMLDEVQTGTYKFGIYYHSADYQNVENEEIIKGNYGVYFIADQCIKPFDAKCTRGINLFINTSVFPDDRNFINAYYGGGFRIHGLFNKRKNDDIGIGAASAWLSNKYYKCNQEDVYKHETAIEFTYRAEISENVVIQPDFQYIINPGVTVENSDVFVGFIRVFISFEK